MKHIEPSGLLRAAESAIGKCLMDPRNEALSHRLQELLRVHEALSEEFSVVPVSSTLLSDRYKRNLLVYHCHLIIAFNQVELEQYPRRRLLQQVEINHRIKQSNLNIRTQTVIICYSSDISFISI